MADPTVYKKLREMSERAIVTKNCMTESEFGRYAPLFQQEIRKGNEHELRESVELLEDYKQRVSLQHPVVVVEDHDSSKVVAVLPPVLVEAPSINKIIGKSTELVATFVSVSNSDSQPEHKKQHVNQLLQAAANVTLKNDPGFQERKDKAAALVNRFEEPSKKDEPPPAPTVTKNMKWE